MTAVEVFIQQVANGLTIGMIYALIALGYTMVYGIVQLINFAHGEVFMVGAYLSLLAYAFFQGLAVGIGGPFFLLAFILIFAMLGTAMLGLLIERFAYRPLRKAPPVIRFQSQPKNKKKLIQASLDFKSCFLRQAFPHTAGKNFRSRSKWI